VVSSDEAKWRLGGNRRKGEGKEWKQGGRRKDRTDLRH